jgi:hypothetical protein
MAARHITSFRPRRNFPVSFWPRRGAALWAVLLALIVPARGALQFDVFLGYDGFVPEASWFPIVCEVYNDGPPFEGVIEVTSGGLGQGGMLRQVRVELPTGTRKLITVPVFNGAAYATDWHVRLRDATGRLREDRSGQRPRGVVRRHSVILGAISRVAAWAPPIRPPLNKQADLQPAVARFQPAVFPDNALVLEGLSALYLNSERAADLRAGQAEALRTWVGTGGHLILGLEQVGDVNSVRWLRDWLGVELTGMTVVDPGSALEDWLRSRVKAAPGTALLPSTPTAADKKLLSDKVSVETPFADMDDSGSLRGSLLNVAVGRWGDGVPVVRAGGQPLLVEFARGLGRVTVVTFSPEREPAKSWKHLPTFWARLAEVPPSLYVSSQSHYPGGWGMDGIFGAMIDSRQVRKLPIFWLLLMLVGYLAIIGPVDQYWLRKINRPMLTWITFPCYVALFSALIYLVGYKLRAGETEWTELHVVDVLGDGDATTLRGRTFGSIYSPVNARYEFAAAQPNSVKTFRGEFAGSWAADAGTVERGRILQTEGSFTADVFVPVWTSQLFVSDWLTAAPAPLSASVHRSGGVWLIKVENRLNQPVGPVCLVAGGRYFELGEVPAGAAREFTASAATNSLPLGEFVARQADRFQVAVQQRRQAFGAMEGGRLDDLPKASMAASFLGLYESKQSHLSFVRPPTFDLSAHTEGNQALLLAWAPGHAARPPLNRFEPRRHAEHTLWRLPIPLHNP